MLKQDLKVLRKGVMNCMRNFTNIDYGTPKSKTAKTKVTFESYHCLIQRNILPRIISTLNVFDNFWQDQMIFKKSGDPLGSSIPLFVKCNYWLISLNRFLFIFLILYLDFLRKYFSTSNRWPQLKHKHHHYAKT